MSHAPPQCVGRPGRGLLFRASALPLITICGVSDALPLPPHLLAFDTDGSDSTGFAPPIGPISAPVTALRLRFDLPVAADLGDFRVVHAGDDDQLATLGCNLAPVGDDVDLTLLGAAVFDTDGVVLTLDAPRGLGAGHYRLLVCDSLLGLDGLPLDGDDDGLPGGIALRDFEIAHDPQLENPGFSGDLSHWSVANLSLGNVTATWDADDADESATSGALRVSGTALSTALVRSDTCIPMLESSGLGSRPASVRMRYRVLSGTVRFVVTARTGFAGEFGEVSCLGPAQWRTWTVDAGGPTLDFQVHDSGALNLQALPLGELSLAVIGTSGAYDVLLDDIGFNLGSTQVFGSNFEGSSN